MRRRSIHRHRLVRIHGLGQHLQPATHLREDKVPFRDATTGVSSPRLSLCLRTQHLLEGVRNALRILGFRISAAVHAVFDLLP